MEIRHLVSFLQLATLHSFTKAGESLGYSQANISLQIRQLENELGVRLFDRIGKAAHLTQYGQMLVPYAQEIVSITTTIENLFHEKENLKGNLRIGFVESLFECIFEESMLNFHKKFPLVTVDITVDASSSLLKMLLNGQLDIACLIDNGHSDPDILYWDTNDCNIVIASSNSHPLTSRLKLDPGDLDGQEFVLMEDAAPYVQEFNRWLQEEEIEIVPCIKVQSPHGAIRLLSNADYLSLLPDFAAKNDAEKGRIRLLEVEGFAQTQQVQFLTHKNKVLTPQIEGFLSEAVAVFRKKADS